VCRDIWALHLSLIPKPPPAEPYLHAQEAEGGSRREENDENSGSQNDARDGKEAGNASSSSSDETEPREDDVDPELAALLRMNSESESSSDSDATPDIKTHTARKEKEGGHRRGRGVYAHDGPASMVAVLVVACWTMRLPMLYMDFIRWVFCGHFADGVQWN
jgi:RNA polymerase I-specific transcription initiation factor RRN7